MANQLDEGYKTVNDEVSSPVDAFTAFNST